ncbi:FMN-binding protein [Gaetbulibacter aestuarii]|uniref:FMN-binding protein n=1 Tax=Gaetbulibacter aestuarii TaxID=1502358 RepID=A0ABW7MYR4_9FLAO
MILKQLYILTLAVTFMFNGLPKYIQKRVDKEIEKTFEIEKFDMSEITISAELQKQVPSKFNNDNLFKIQSGEKLICYAYVAQAPSKTAQFDYLVLLNPDLTVAGSKVLIYREEYGGEIGSTRWLKQFIGKKPGDDLKYGDNVSAISGATISVRSMTNAMEDLLESVKILHTNNVL